MVSDFSDCLLSLIIYRKLEKALSHSTVVDGIEARLTLNFSHVGSFHPSLSARSSSLLKFVSEYILIFFVWF